jgi:CrcB protein
MPACRSASVRHHWVSRRLTTFSTYSAEAVALLSREQLGLFLVHLGGHLGGSLLLTVLGIYTVRALQL